MCQWGRIFEIDWNALTFFLLLLLFICIHVTRKDCFCMFEANDINLQKHSILSNNSLCLRFNMTLTTRNVSFWSKSFIYTLLRGLRLAPPHDRCNGGHILVIWRLSPYLPNFYIFVNNCEKNKKKNRCIVTVTQITEYHSASMGPWNLELR